MQIFLTNKFLSYNFLGYGVRVWAYYSQPAEERRHGGINPMCETFPRLVSCDYVRYTLQLLLLSWIAWFSRYGFAGGKTSLNAICILALNMINDKIFLVLWLWYFVLLFIGFYRFVYRIVQISSARVRQVHDSLNCYTYISLFHFQVSTHESKDAPIFQDQCQHCPHSALHPELLYRRLVCSLPDVAQLE